MAPIARKAYFLLKLMPRVAYKYQYRFGFNLVFGFIFLLGSNLTYAYIPPSQFIVKMWVNKHSGIRNIKIKSIVTGYEDNHLTETHFTDTTVFDANTGTIKSWASDSNNRKLYTVEKSSNFISPTGKLLLPSNTRSLTLSLLEQGIPIQTEESLLHLKTEEERRGSEKVSLDRWQGSKTSNPDRETMDAWVIRSSPLKSETDPQIWFQMGTFFPLKLISMSSSANPPYHFNFEDYRESHGYPYPRYLTVMKNGKTTLFLSQLIDVTSGPEGSNSKSASTQNLNTGNFTSAGNAVSPTLKALIQTYYDLVR